MEEKPSTQSMKATPSGLSSAVDLLKAAEDQFTSTSSEISRPKKSLAELKREMLTKANGQKDKPKFEINPRVAPGAEGSKLPATIKHIVSETNFGQLSRPLAKQPSRFGSKPAKIGPDLYEPDALDSAEVTARKMRLQNRQKKVTEQIGPFETIH